MQEHVWSSWWPAGLWPLAWTTSPNSGAGIYGCPATVPWWGFPKDRTLMRLKACRQACMNEWVLACSQRQGMQCSCQSMIVGWLIGWLFHVFMLHLLMQLKNIICNKVQCVLPSAQRLVQLSEASSLKIHVCWTLWNCVPIHLSTLFEAQQFFKP